MLALRFTPVAILFTCLLTGLYSSGAAAEQVSGLYDVTVPVASQSSRDLRKASKEGLKRVFIRVSGNADVVNNSQIAASINRSQKLMNQFEYRQVEKPEEAGDQLLAVLEFEPALVDRQLRAAGLPLWSSNRPTVLVWMVVEDRQGRRFAGAENDPEIVQAIMRHAQRRGLAIKLPALDLEDMVAVSPDELWQLNSQRAKAAAERYAADTVLVGRASHLTNGQWLGQWRYLFNQQQYGIDGDAVDIDRYIAAGLDTVADLLAAEYAITPVNIAEGGVLIRLTGINNFVDYARAISYLEGVAAIHHANVIDVQQDEIIVRLVADGLLPQLEQAFALDRRLLPTLSGAYQGEYPVVLDYRWPNVES